jgi:hypothetical protein
MPKYLDHALLPLRDDVRLRATPLGRVFRRSDLEAWGIPGDTVIPMTRRDWWVRLHHGVYADSRDIGDDASDPRQHALLCAASIRALREPAFAFGPSAASLHGLALQRGLLDTVNLVRPLGHDGRALSRRITATDRVPPALVRTQHLTSADVMEVGGVPVVVPALAAVSASVLAHPDWMVAMMDSAAWDAPERLGQMAEYSRGLQNLAGIGDVRSVLPLVRSGAQTPLESISRVRLMRCGLPEPRLQVPFYDEAGLIGIVDMYWEDLGVIGEADGMLKYRTGADLIAEKHREDRLRRKKPVVRWDWTQAWDSPHVVAQRVRAASASRRWL